MHFLSVVPMLFYWIWTANSLLENLFSLNFHGQVTFKQSKKIFAQRVKRMKVNFAIFVFFSKIAKLIPASFKTKLSMHAIIKSTCGVMKYYYLLYLACI